MRAHDVQRCYKLSIEAFCSGSFGNGFRSATEDSRVQAFFPDMGATSVHRPNDHPTTKFRQREARQAEKDDRSSNEKKKSRMIAERLEFQTFNNKQSQHCQPSNQGKPCPAAVC
eukprot:1148865-Pelagomonas_calceolata.AAC.1